MPMACLGVRVLLHLGTSGLEKKKSQTGIKLLGGSRGDERTKLS